MIAKRAPQLADALHQRVIRHREIRPDRRKELVLGDEPAVVLGEMPQDRECLWPECDLGFTLEQGAVIEVKRIAGETEPFRSCRHPQLVVIGGHRAIACEVDRKRLFAG